MADRSLWGLAKFWITTAAEQGVDVHDEQALQDFVGRAQGGEVPYDPEVLQTIVERHRRSSGPVRSEPQLPVALPGDDVLREQAAGHRSCGSCASWPSGPGATAERSPVPEGCVCQMPGNS